MPITAAIAPIFVLIILGYALRRGGIPSQDFWNLNDRLVYFLLMPAVFFEQISTADLSGAALGGYSATLYGGFAVATFAGLLAARALSSDPASATSVVQGAARFNTFIALAVAEALFGAPGLQMAVLGAAILVPGVNVAVVAMFALMLPSGTGRIDLGGLARTLLGNPLILAILAGLGWNAAGLGAWPVFHPTLAILGDAALPIMLLSVGANLKLRGLQAERAPLAAAIACILLLFPLVVLGLSLLLGLDPLQAQVAVIFAALPTGVAAYTLARQLGGDATLLASVITLSTLLSFATMPATLWLTGLLFPIS